MNLKFGDSDSDSDVDENCFSSMSNMNLMGVLGLEREQRKTNEVVHLNLSSEVSKGLPVALDLSLTRSNKNPICEMEQNASNVHLLSPPQSNFSMLSTVDEIIKTLSTKTSPSPRHGFAEPAKDDDLAIPTLAQNSNVGITPTLGSALPSRLRRSRLSLNVSHRVARDLPSTSQTGSLGAEGALGLTAQAHSKPTTVPPWYLDSMKSTLRHTPSAAEGLDSLLRACEGYVRARLPTGPVGDSLMTGGDWAQGEEREGTVSQLTREQVLELELDMYKAASGMLWEKICASHSYAERREAELKQVAGTLWFSLCALEVIRLLRECQLIPAPAGSLHHNLTASEPGRHDVDAGGEGYEAERVRRIERNRRAMADFGLAGSPVRDKGKNAGRRRNKKLVDSDEEREEEELSLGSDESPDDTYKASQSEVDSDLAEQEAEDHVHEEQSNRRGHRRSGSRERVGSGSHPSLVDPEEPGLGPAERFRAEMVRAVYESEGTSEAEALMDSSVPSVVARAFREVGWQERPQALAVGCDSNGPRTRSRAAAGGGPKPNRALLAGDSEDSAGPGPGLPRGLGNDAGAAGGADSGEGSGSLSSARKRLRDLAWDEPPAADAGKAKRGDRSGSLRRPAVRRRKDPEREAVIAAAASAQGKAELDLARGSWCRRTGVTGKYYITQNKYLCNNCGRAGHVKRTCDMPPRVLDSALEALGWQVCPHSERLKWGWLGLVRNLCPCLRWLASQSRC